MAVWLTTRLFIVTVIRVDAASHRPEKMALKFEMANWECLQRVVENQNGAYSVLFDLCNQWNIHLLRCYPKMLFSVSPGWNQRYYSTFPFHWPYWNRKKFLCWLNGFGGTEISDVEAKSRRSGFALSRNRHSSMRDTVHQLKYKMVNVWFILQVLPAANENT